MLGLALFLLAGAVVVGGYSAYELARFDRAETRRALIVYSAGQTMARDVDVRAVDLAGTLGRLGYGEVKSAPGSAGQFRRTPGGWDIFLRGGAREDPPRRERGTA